jgi:hypothetical protein
MIHILVVDPLPPKGGSRTDIETLISSPLQGVWGYQRVNKIYFLKKYEELT